MSQERIVELEKLIAELRPKFGGYDYRTGTNAPRTLTIEEQKTYYAYNNELHQIRSDIYNAEQKRIREEKDAALLAQGKTREAANARLAEITEQVKALLMEAEQHASDFDLTFQIETPGMSYPLDFDGQYQQYEGWDSSNC